MNQLINYIHNCLQPVVGITEFYIGNTINQETFDNMVQDAIMVVDNLPNKGNFEFIKVGHKYICKKIYRDISWLNPENGNFEWNNTSLPLYRRLLPPPYETVDHKLIIKSIINEVDPDKKCNYIEYGVREGNTMNYLAPNVNHVYAIDLNDTNICHDNISFYKMYTDQFSELLPTINYNFAFIDADHSHGSSLRDFENIYKHIKVGGYIFLHDTYPCDVSFLSKMACGDCYKTPIEIKKKYPLIEILTLPLNPGVTVIRKNY